VTWQISLGRVADVGQPIAPALLFMGDQYGRADEESELYTSTFPDSEVEGILRWSEGEHEGEREGAVKHAQFRLFGETFMAMESGYAHPSPATRLSHSSFAAPTRRRSTATGTASSKAAIRPRSSAGG
jgi:predicted 3-demethylubiquinone-9 3-methyltransferase (glyoxalase superfamily)